MNELTELEKAVIDKLLAGDHPALARLREQVQRARVTARTNTGAGFFCDFEMDDGVPTVHGTFQLGDVQATISGVSHGAGFLLFVKDGRVSMLEGYTYDEPWPDPIHNYSLRYIDPSRKAELAKLG